MNLMQVMKSLSSERRVFHSEADFQHSLGWKIREMYSDASVRAEVKLFYPMEKATGKKRKRRKSLDLLVSLQGKTTAIELKYKTALVDGLRRISVDGQYFMIPREGAQDICRYSFLSDIMRLEREVAKRSDTEGYAVFLTNDPLYWTKPKGNTKDAQFRIHDRTLPRRMTWRDDTAESTKGAGRDRPIILRNSYTLEWIDYAVIPTQENNRFRFLLVKV